MKTSLFLSTLLGALLVTGAAAAANTTYTADLDPDNELPKDSVNSAATGSARFTYFPDTKKICGHITFNPTDFPYTQAHLHEGDETKTNGGVLVEFAGDKGAGEIKFTVVDLTDEVIGKITGGETYVNVHSEKFGDGEMRGQATKEDPAGADEECSEVDAGASSSGASSSGASSSGTGATSSSGSTGTDGGTSGTAASPASTDDGGCNTSGSHGADAAALLALGAIITAAARKRRNKKA